MEPVLDIEKLSYIVQFRSKNDNIDTIIILFVGVRERERDSDGYSVAEG